ncbi:hypothetical protein [Terrisporobacter hibernicus]|uniref:OB domain-containing protein n=2 Tax=Peptostreptococcaceae TaxID=186804 RepID=A0AAX2ZLE6_9FIRM|nr:hypothetical protein [Terrisporobacter hibernicus]UEL49140.1 hypothetical protein JW646_06750 [Terrisporobacter hibernicus]
MRKSLKPYLGQEITVRAIVSKIENNSNEKNRVLLTNITNREDNRFLTDHLWYQKSKFNLVDSLQVGDMIEIKGKVAVYLRALNNKHIANKFDYHIDFEPNNLRKIIHQKYEKRAELCTNTCKSKVIVNYYFTISDLKNIYYTLENKDYLYIKFIKDIVRARLLNNPDYESILIINNKGTIYTKNKKYEEPINLKANEMVLCKFGKKLSRVGKIYNDYALILEKQGKDNSFDEINRWHDLPNNDKNKMKIVSDNMDYISREYIYSVEKLKRYIYIEIQNNCNKDYKITWNHIESIENFILIKTSLVKNRVHKNYYFKKNDLEVIYRSLIKKRFSIMMKIFYIIKEYLNNNIDYDSILVINNKGQIYFIEVDRWNVNRSNYLETCEIEICRFGKNTIRKSNIYEDYSKVLKKEWGNIDDLDIWDQWYNLDNENSIKKNIVENNFQIRKKVYIIYYNVLVKAIEKEIEEKYK